MSEDKKETNDILEEAIASVKAAKKQTTETPVEEKKTEPSQEELLKLIKELKSEISDIKKANEEDDLDDVDDDSEDDDDLDDEDDNSENEGLKSEVEKLKKQQEGQNKQNSSTPQEGNSKMKWTIGCLSLVIGCFVVGIVLAMCCFSSPETVNNSNETSIVSLPIPTGEYAGIIMFYREYKWYFFGACIFIFLCKTLLREGEEKWGLACRYAIFTGLLLYPILSQDYKVYNEDDEFTNVLVFFGFFTAFFIIPTLYWFFGEISKCPKCGTTYAFDEVRRDYDHALAPKYARDINGDLKKDSHGNSYQVQTVYYRVTLRCKNCGYTKQVMRKVEEKI